MNPAADSNLIVKQILLAMGTQVSVTIALDAPRRRADAELAIDEIARLIAAFGGDCWAWGAGRLAGLNRDLAAGGAVAIPADLQPLFRRAWAARQNTGGLYEPRIAALVQLWGFAEAGRLRNAPPAARDIAALLDALHAAPDYDGGAQYGPAPGIGWDFGGIGKGYIVDQALDVLRLRGFGDAIVDAGGNLAARGARGARAWRVGIRDPRVSAVLGQLLASLEIGDETVNTHGDDQRCFEHAGRRYAHILDPRSGWPAQGLRALTVVHADACVAEAEGAALFVAGDPGWRGLAGQLGLDQVLTFTARGAIQATPKLASRLKPQPGIVIEKIAL